MIAGDHEASHVSVRRKLKKNQWKEGCKQKKSHGIEHLVLALLGNLRFFSPFLTDPSKSKSVIRPRSSMGLKRWDFIPTDLDLVLRKSGWRGKKGRLSRLLGVLFFFFCWFSFFFIFERLGTVWRFWELNYTWNCVCFCLFQPLAPGTIIVLSRGAWTATLLVFVSYAACGDGCHWQIWGMRHAGFWLHGRLTTGSDHFSIPFFSERVINWKMMIKQHLLRLVS